MRQPRGYQINRKGKSPNLIVGHHEVHARTIDSKAPKPLGKAVRQIASYQGQQVVNIAVGLFSVPITFSVLGPEVWGSLAAAQSAGLILAVFVAWGWSVTGPAQIALLGERARVLFFARASMARLWLLGFAIPLILATSTVMFPGQWLVAFLWMLNAVLTYLLPQWFYVGMGSPKKVFNWIVLPTNLTNLACILLLALSKDVLLYSLAQTSTTAVTLGLASAQIWRKLGHKVTATPGSILRYLNTGIDGLLNSAASSICLYAPVVIVLGLAPTQAPTFAIADKLLRYARSSLSTITQWAQSYVPSGNNAGLGNRARHAIRVSSLGGAIVGCGYFFVYPAVVVLLTSDVSSLPLSVLLALSLSLFFQNIAQVVALSSFAKIGSTRIVAVTSLATLCVDALISAALYYPFGVMVAISWGLCIGEVSGCLVLLMSSKSQERKVINSDSN